MSDTAAPADAGPLADPVVVQSDPAAAPLVVAFATFAASMQPRRVPFTRNGAPVVHRGRTLMTMIPGHPDEVFLRLVRIRHGGEKHDMAGWRTLIDAMRVEPVHPSDPRAVR